MVEFDTTHATNLVKLQGWLPEQTEEFIEKLEDLDGYKNKRKNNKMEADHNFRARQAARRWPMLPAHRL